MTAGVVPFNCPTPITEMLKASPVNTVRLISPSLHCDTPSALQKQGPKGLEVISVCGALKLTSGMLKTC